MFTFTHNLIRSRTSLLFCLFLGGALLAGYLSPARNPARTEAGGSYMFGTLVTDATRASAEAAAGLRLAHIDLGWRDYEPTEGVYNQTYMNDIKQRISTFRAAGMQVVLGIALHYTPNWVYTYPDSRYVNQYGDTDRANLVFNATLRQKAERFIAKVMADVGPSNIWAVRVGLDGAGHLFYPPEDVNLHTNSYWAFDANAQGGSNRPASVPASPFPGWQPGMTTYNGSPFTTGQVRQWYEWYLGAMVDAANWQVRAYRNTGFQGYIQIVTAGIGQRPSDYEAAIADYLRGGGDRNHTMGRGVVWNRVIDLITDRNNVVIDIASLADGCCQPPNDVCQATDTSVSLTDPQINSWSSARWIAYNANRVGMAKIGENPSSQSSPSLYGRAMMDAAASQMQACGLQGLMWAHDFNLYDGVSNITLQDYAAVAQQYNGSPAPAPTNTPVPAPTSTPVPASGSGLRGDYYDNLDFTGWKLARTDPQINFSWSNTTPDPSMAADTYSVRWTGQVQPSYSETYTFYTVSDDGVRLWVNGQLVVDNWTDHDLYENSGQVTLAAGVKYDIKLEYYQGTGGAGIQLRWSSASQAKQLIPSSRLFPANAPAPTCGTGTGLKGDYFTFSGATPPDWSTAKLVRTRTDARVNFSWGTGKPFSALSADRFMVRWTGQVQPAYSETYTFYVTSDDGARLWVNGQLVVDDWTDHGVQERSGQIALSACQRYDIKLEYYENTGTATAQLRWSSARQAKSVTPQTSLFPPSGAPVAVAAPQITTITPSLVKAGMPGVDLVLEGENLRPQSIVTWNGVEQATTYVSDTRLQAAIADSDLALPGPASVSIADPDLGQDIANVQPILIYQSSAYLPIVEY